MGMLQGSWWCAQSHGLPVGVLDSLQVVRVRFHHQAQLLCEQRLQPAAAAGRQIHLHVTPAMSRKHGDV